MKLTKKQLKEMIREEISKLNQPKMSMRLKELISNGWVLSEDESGDKTVKNPITGREIKVKTALSYPHDHPAHKAAKSTDSIKGDNDKSKYNDNSYWEDDNEYGPGREYDEDDNDSWTAGPSMTSDRLSKIETALEDDLQLNSNGFETSRESGGGEGGWEGPMTIYDKNAFGSDDYVSLSVGSSNNDGKFSIVFVNADSEPMFEPDWDALTGDSAISPQQAYKITKALMKMPEVKKLLKG